jgi:glycosyltransferase involved in cell wall biosynthesis
MKILMATPYFHPRIGGLELYAEQIARGLAARGHEIHIVTSGASRESVTYAGLTIHRLPVAFMLSQTPIHPGWAWHLRKLIHTLQPDLINVHAPVPSMALMAAMAAGRTPVVTTYHAGSMKKGRFVLDLMIAAYETRMLPWLLRRSDAIICSSGFVEEKFLHPWRTKTSVITPGVDAARFSPSPESVVKGRLLFVGNFSDPRKGLDILLRAAGTLSDVTLRVIGEGRPVVQERVTYLGTQSPDEVAREMAAADVLILPSVTEAESFGMVLLEAMSSGRPVIGSEIGGIPYLVSHGQDGLLVPPGDAQALATAIRTLVGDRELNHQLATHARQKAATQYDWHSRISATEQVLTEVYRAEATDRMYAVS